MLTGDATSFAGGISRLLLRGGTTRRGYGVCYPPAFQLNNRKGWSIQQWHEARPPRAEQYNKVSLRGYLHFGRTMPHDYELPMDTMPSNVKSLMGKDPKKMDFFENYWYWKVRGEASILDAEALPQKSYKQLARDMGLQIVTEQTEHMCGVLELYEYLKSSPFVGPFGTIKEPVLCPSVHNERFVGCTGGTGDNEHVPIWFRCREGFLYRCGECDQVFMLVRVLYSLPEGVDPFPVDPEVEDVFDMSLIESGNRKWNSGQYVRWPVGNEVLFGDVSGEHTTEKGATGF